MIIFLIIFFFLSLTVGQFGTINISPGVTIYLHDVVLLLLLLIGAGNVWKTKKKPEIKLAKQLAVFIFIGILSLLINAYRFSPLELLSSSLYLWRFVFYSLVYILIVQLPRISKTVWQWGLYGMGVLLACLGILQFIFFPSLRSLMFLGWDEHYGRLFSTLFDPNFTGIVLVLTLFWGMSLINQKKLRLLILPIQMIVALAIVLTFSRSAYLALLTGILCWVVLTKNVKILLVIIIFAIVYLLVPKTSLDVNRLDRQTSSMARVTNWEQSLQQFSQAPIVGVGFDTLRVLNARTKSVDALGIPSHDAAGVNSSLLLILITTGIVGGAAYLWLLIKATLLVWQSQFKILGMSLLSALFVDSFFNNSLFYAWVMIWVWVFLAIVEKSLQEKMMNKKSRSQY